MIPGIDDLGDQAFVTFLCRVPNSDFLVACVGGAIGHACTRLCGAALAGFLQYLRHEKARKQFDISNTNSVGAFRASELL